MSAIWLLTACPSGGATTASSTDDATTSGSTTGDPPTTSSGTEPTTGTTAPDVTTSGTTSPDDTTTGTTDPGDTGSTGSSGDPGSSGDTGSTSTGPAPACGDGDVDDGEACDVVNDNSLGDGDGCTIDCQQECTALRFAGETVATAAEPATLDVTSVTMGAWHKAQADAPHGVVAAKRGSPLGGHFTYQIVAGAGGVTARLQIGVNAQFLDLSAPMELPDGEWHHLAVTYDEATGEGVLYRDGAEIASGVQGNGLVAASAEQPFTIGAITIDGGLNGESVADIANVVVYDKAMSPAEVMALSQGIYPAGPRVFYPVHEGTGTMSADASGNGHTLTVPDGGWVDDGPFCQ